MSDSTDKQQMNITGIIPARYGSTRFPGKPLVEIQGKTMIQRVYEQAIQARLLQQVFVATDDQRICDHVRGFGGNVIMTNTHHNNGTERCAEAAELIGGNHDAIINIQGDEPYIEPTQIDLLAQTLRNDPYAIATLVKRLDSFDDYQRNTVVKVAFDVNHYALYFSRSPIPYIRSADAASVFYGGQFYKHIGIYGFPKTILQEVVKLPESPLEKAESLEQLRWLENGYRIKVQTTEHESQSIDTPEDLERLQNNGHWLIDGNDLFFSKG